MPQNFQNYIAGAWHDGETTIENINSSDLSDSIGYYEQANLLQLNNALDAAALAQKQREKTGLEVRQSISMNIGNELMARREERGRLLSREEGKLLSKGMGEICSSYSPREKGRYDEEFYTTVKTSYSAAGQPD